MGGLSVVRQYVPVVGVCIKRKYIRADAVEINFREVEIAKNCRMPVVKLSIVKYPMFKFCD